MKSSLYIVIVVIVTGLMSVAEAGPRFPGVASMSVVMGNGSWNDGQKDLPKKVVFSSGYVAMAIQHPTGHYEQRIVGWKTVYKPVYRPKVLKTVIVNGQYYQYVESKEYTDWVPVRKPIYGLVWVP